MVFLRYVVLTTTHFWIAKRNMKYSFTKKAIVVVELSISAETGYLRLPPARGYGVILIVSITNFKIVIKN